MKGLPETRHFDVTADKRAILKPILEHPKNTAERAATFKSVAGQLHKIGNEVKRVAVSTLRGWVTAFEKKGAAALAPQARSDKGKARVFVVKRWDDRVGLPDAVKARIAAELHKTAAGMIVKRDISDKTVVKACAAELMRLTLEAGAIISKAELIEACKLNSHWVKSFQQYRPVHQFRRDHKAWSDSHQARVQRELEALPENVLYGDEHYIDVILAPLKEPIRVHLIGWLDGSSHYLWATLVILGKGQGATQQDVARSLFDVTQCDWGGLPKTVVIDNGSSYDALGQGIDRLSVYAALENTMRQVKSLPYSPEGKGRIEGAFGILEKGFLKALEGHIGGDRMKSPTKSKGKPRDPYPHGIAQFVEAFNLAVAQYNATPQDGQLGGLSPRAMLDAKIAATGWRAEKPSAEIFDLVFSKEITRDVNKGVVKIDNRPYYAPILAKLVGEKAVPILVPLRDPEGPVILFRDGDIHRLTHETFGQMDGEGARKAAAMVAAQKAEMRRRESQADLTVDVPALISQSLDLSPPTANPPNNWTMVVNDKAGRLTAPRTEAEHLAEEDAAARQHSEEIQAFMMEAGRREASGGNR